MASQRTAYLDAAGRPRLSTSIVAFLDILGFSQATVASASSDDAQRLLERIAAAIDDSRQFVRQSFDDTQIADPYRWAIKFFSDNLALGYALDDTSTDRAESISFVIRCAQRYQLRMTLNGIFLRGALTVGDVCLTDEIIFGSALIECYQLESNSSIVPRVLLAEPLRDLVIATTNHNATSASAARDPVCRDVDGWWFVNYLDAARESAGVNWDFIELHKRSILESLSHTTRHDVLPKFGWACRYHNVFCHWHRDDPGYSDRYRIDRIDEQSTIHRPSEANQGVS